jgi:hypothetical protein
LRRNVTIVLCALAVLLAMPDVAAAAPNCFYDPGTRTVTLDLRVGLAAPSDRDWRVHRFAADGDGTLRWSSWGSWGINVMLVPCLGATVHNTDIVDIIGNDTGHETMNFGPFAETEILFHLDLAGAPSIGDEVVVEGRLAGDTITIGATGIALDASGTLITLDSEIVKVHASGGDGADTITGQGGFGAGPATSVALALAGGEGRDRLTGGRGPDRIVGDADADELEGGPGEDRLDGVAGNDTLFARDGDADEVIGGGGSDRAQVDGIDTVKGVESRF